MKLSRFFLALMVQFLTAFVLGVGSALAQCSTVNLLTPFNTPLTTNQAFAANNTVCHFGGDYNGVRGVISCLAMSVPITIQNQASYENLVSWIEAKMPILPGQNSLISSTVDYGFFMRRDNTAAQALQVDFANKATLLDWANNGYPPAPTFGRGTYTINVSGSLRRVAFSPVVRTGSYTADVTTEFFGSGNYFAVTGYDKSNPALRFSIYRLLPATVPNNFMPLTVCLGNNATAVNDFLHRYAETAAPMTSLAVGRRFIHQD